MPGFATHIILGRLVMDKMKDGILKDTITSFRGSWELGLQGPDVYFCYPSVGGCGKRGSIGYLMHEYGTRDYFSAFIDMIREIEPSERRECAISYFAGFISHYFCDVECHPYVYSMIQYSSQSSWNRHPLRHAYLEDCIDLLLLEKYLGIRWSQFRPSRYMPDRHEARLLGDIMSESITRIGGRLSEGGARHLIDIFRAHVFIRSFSMLFGRMDAEKALNMHHIEWDNPWDRSLRTSESFEDLLDRAQIENIRAYELLETVLESVDSSDKELCRSSERDLLDYLGNRSYHRGFEVLR